MYIKCTQQCSLPHSKIVTKNLSPNTKRPLAYLGVRPIVGANRDLYIRPIRSVKHSTAHWNQPTLVVPTSPLFSGKAPESDGASQNSLPNTRSVAYICVRNLLLIAGSICTSFVSGYGTTLPLLATPGSLTAARREKQSEGKTVIVYQPLPLPEGVFANRPERCTDRLLSFPKGRQVLWEEPVKRFTSISSVSSWGPGYTSNGGRATACFNFLNQTLYSLEKGKV